VHHIFEDCPNGQQILPENRRDGTNGWPLCGLLTTAALALDAAMIHETHMGGEGS
jgi:hypothetical protein